MLEIKQTVAFKKWRESLKDYEARALIASRLDRLAFGHFGDVAFVGDGVCELRIHYGSGHRIYYCRHGQTWVVLLCGGNKSSQVDDIKKARKIAAQWSSDHV
ncbi:MAG: type II toxin-antitoxin system RelE/ParE family toxin [Pseudomonadota bacterium]